MYVPPNPNRPGLKALASQARARHEAEVAAVKAIANAEAVAKVASAK